MHAFMHFCIYKKNENLFTEKKTLIQTKKALIASDISLWCVYMQHSDWYIFKFKLVHLSTGSGAAIFLRLLPTHYVLQADYMRSGK